MLDKKFVAIDLGAESGRSGLGSFDGKRISLSEISRFPTYHVQVSGHLFWDVLAIFAEIKKATKAASAQAGPVHGLGVTTWGVDHALIGKDNLLLCNPFHYRDKRTDGAMEKVFAKVPKERVFQETGIQFMQLNTLFQLYATLQDAPYLLNEAETLLFMPDLFNFWLTGEKLAEYTIASTSQMYNSTAQGQSRAPRGDWARSVLDQLGIPTHFLPTVVAPGTPLGTLHSELREELRVPEIPVLAVCGHDTASAVFAVPARGEDWAYLSSGTWSLLGVETPEPIINQQSFQHNFTNEGGFGGSIRLLKNIMGLWILQECKRHWARQGQDYSYEQLVEMASAAEAFSAFIDVENTEFLFPGDMPEKIRNYCRQTGQRLPKDEGQVARVVLESLALEYRYAMDNLEEIIGRKIEVLHVVGGGSQNRLLSQFASSATRKVVMAGPAEATAIGNVLVQALAQGDISDVSQAREIVRNSFPLIVYQPKDSAAWEEKYQVYRHLKKVSHV